MATPKFKVGDRVRFLGSHYECDRRGDVKAGLFPGRLLTVSSCDMEYGEADGGWYYFEELEDTHGTFAYGRELAAVEPPSAKPLCANNPRALPSIRILATTSNNLTVGKTYPVISFEQGGVIEDGGFPITGIVVRGNNGDMVYCPNAAWEWAPSPFPLYVPPQEDTLLACERLHRLLGLSDPKTMPEVLQAAVDKYREFEERIRWDTEALMNVTGQRDLLSCENQEMRAQVESISAIVKMPLESLLGGRLVAVPLPILNEVAEALRFYTVSSDSGGVARRAREQLGRFFKGAKDKVPVTPTHGRGGAGGEGGVL